MMWKVQQSPKHCIWGKALHTLSLQPQQTQSHTQYHQEGLYSKSCTHHGLELAITGTSWPLTTA